MSPLFNDGDVVLFQGDSITDAGRDRLDPRSMGAGYAMIASSWFQALYPSKNVNFLNRGIGGDRAKDLLKRWQKDCLDLHPSWVSILVGINDTWRRYDSNDPTSTQDYEDVYRSLLERTKAALNARLILCEPFVLSVSADRETWREDLDPKIDVVRKLAREYGALYVPFDGLFAQAAAQRESAFWAADGVHPSPAGHALMAQAWLRAVNAL
ncbi:GDSL family lipase [Ktedonosporobacter rubrisoli]|uniref:GDSL family lipase n=1 Tax=Ktedonosporobacter rubrisoli TaxID=2509675 RepID=A0A4P6JP55_KTERU|nr:SGNH/GDSL hydrolase family protein [Ktedonosporobacter rubrisoli]QBD76536.1 GDSL family lipase [Ktedonosporobacter rubrisoli]